MNAASVTNDKVILCPTYLAPPTLTSYTKYHRITMFFTIFGYTDMNTSGEVTSQSLWSQYDRHFVGIRRHSVLS